MPWNGASISSGFTSGTGTEDDPYIVSNPDALAYLASQVNGGNSYEGVFFKLESDLNINGYPVIVGDSVGHPFAGNFNGNGHRIYNISINSSAVLFGLFGYVNGVVENLALYNFNVKSTCAENEAKVGAIAYLGSSGQIKKVYLYSDSAIKGSCEMGVFTGGLVGYSEGVIDNCYSRASVNSTSSTFKSYAGGLVGYVKLGTISNSFVASSVSSNGFTDLYSNAGRLVGNAEESSVFEDCYVDSASKMTRFGIHRLSNNRLFDRVDGIGIIRVSLDGEGYIPKWWFFF